jgi:spermidine synthase
MTDRMEWVSEMWQDVETRYRVRSVIYDDKSDFQHLQIVDTYRYGKMLLLDGIVQTTERDEFIYHEMMVHVPMLSHSEPKNALIIGGGDGGILREVLRYKSIEKATIVEIDPMVIEFCKEYLPGLSGGAFNDQRTELIINDGSVYVEETEDKYDIIIVDSPDPVGPARALFSEKFYSGIHRILGSGGIMTRQTGSVNMQPDEQKEAYALLQGMFDHVLFYLYTVPTYIGGLFSTVFCSDSVNPMDIGYDELNSRFNQALLKTRYYSPEIHRGAFCVPKFFQENLQ